MAGSICAVVKGPTYEEAKKQIEKVLHSADLIELRLDLFVEEDAAKRLREDYSIPMIFTVKDPKLAGRFAALKPEYLDLESDTPLPIIEKIISEHPEIKIIISSHDFEKTPEKFSPKPGFLSKIAVNAQNSIDMLRLLCWVQESKMIGISMGDYGQPGRILAPILGSPITYACIDEDLKTAPGQITVDALEGLSLTQNTAIYGLIGDPVDKSISDKTHNFCFKACEIEAVYVKMEVKAEELEEFLKLARRLPFRGLSVTMPLKKCILPYLDEIDPKAKQIGAVNTLVFEHGKIIGYNTDGVGALRAIECSVKGQKIAILGTGGAAQSIAYEARLQGAHVVLLKRNECETEYDILINCTPALSPIDPAYILPKALVMDITTNPRETPFLRQALEKGCKVIYGYQMFIEQALGQFDLWFKDRIDKEILERKVREIL